MSTPRTCRRGSDAIGRFLARHGVTTVSAARLPTVDRSDLTSRAGATAAFVALLRDADTALDARGLKLRLISRGVDPATADLAWRRAQPALRRQAEVSFDAARSTYRYGLTLPGAPDLSGEEALDRLLPPRLTTRRAALATIVRTAIKERDDLEAKLRTGYLDGRAMRAAQERQAQISAVRALADVASEVEELAAAGAGAGVTAQRVRALAQAFGLAPIGRAGELTDFEPAWHQPIGGWPPDGTRVCVIRPGYTWPTTDEVVLVCKAHVAWLGPQ